MTIEDHNKLLVRRFYDELNQGNCDIVHELVAPNYVGHFSGLPDLRGINDLIEFHRNAMAAIPPRHVKLQTLVAEKDKVVKQYSVYGVHKGEIAGVPPTHKEVNINGFSLLRIENEKIVEQWTLDDLFSFFQQLRV